MKTPPATSIELGEEEDWKYFIQFSNKILAYVTLENDNSPETKCYTS
jgi:hypothetical protein